MNRFSLIGGFAIVVLWSVAAAAETPNEQPNAKEIPLDQIWAYQMPGTLDVRKLEPPSPRDSLVEPIQHSLGRGGGAKEPATGFAVSGKVDEALRQAYEVLVAGETASQRFATGNEEWIVFFSYEFGDFVHLHHVERSGNKIVISYRFVPHDSKHLTKHFALIPLGELHTGQYRVSIVNSPMEQESIDMGFKPISDAVAGRIVCRPFEFVVTKESNERIHFRRRSQ